MTDQKIAETNAVIHSHVSGPSPLQPAAPPLDPFMQMIAIAAKDPDTNVEKLNALYELMQRREADRGRAAFNEALSAAKGEIGPVLKNRVVDFTSAKGKTHYKHEDFAEVARTVDPALARHGLSYRFRAEQKPGAGDRPGRLSITCILAHSQGYSENTTLEAPEDHSGNKNAIQAVGSSATYLQRQTLKLALGLSASEDDDGRASGDAPATISGDDIAYIQEGVTQTQTDLPNFLELLQAPSIEEMNETQFSIAVGMLQRKAKAMKHKAEKPAQ